MILLFTIGVLKAQEDSLKYKSYEYLLEKIGVHEYNNPERGEIYAIAYINKGKEDKEFSKIGLGYYFLSLMNDERKTIQYIDSALFYNEKISNNRLQVIYYSKKGDLLYNTGDYKEALNSYLNAKKYINKEVSVYNASDIDYNIGLIKLRIGDFKEAQKSFKESYQLHIDNKITDKYSEGYLINLNSLAFSYLYTHQLDSASFYNDIITKKAKKDENLSYYFYKSRILEAIINYDRGNYKQGLDSIIKYEPHIEKSKDSLDLALIYLYKGKGLQKLGDWNHALPLFKKVDTIIQKRKIFNSQLKENYNILYDYYKSKDDIKNQIIYIEKLHHFDSILYNNNSYLKTTLLEKYDGPKYVEEKEKLIAKLQNKDISRKYTIYTLTLLTLLFLASTFYYYRKKHLYKKRFDKLIDEKNIKSQIIPETKIIKKELQIPENIVAETLKKLEHFEKENQFLNNNITLNSLAKKLGTNSAYLSKIINFHKDKNFSVYLSDLRIDYVVQALKEQPKLREYTIKAIAFEVGFKNSESFTTAFYKKNKLYPSYFIKELQKREKAI